MQKLNLPDPPQLDLAAPDQLRLGKRYSEQFREIAARNSVI